MAGASKVFLTFFLLLSALILDAAPKFLFRNIGTEDGLSSNTVRSLLQDRDGLLWFGTGEGLDCYDGVRIRRYLINPSQADLSNYINAIHQDKNGSIWVGTDRGVFFKDAGSSDFRQLQAETETGDTVSSIVFCITSDYDGNIWIATRDNGLFEYIPKDNILQCFDFGVENPSAECVFVDEDNVVWACVMNAPDYIFTYNRSTGEFQQPKLNYYGCNPTRTVSIISDSSGYIWFGTWNEGLYKLDKKTRYVTRQTRQRDLYALDHLHTITEISPSVFLMGSDRGLSWYDSLTGEFKLYDNKLDDPTSLPNKFVYPIVKDAEGGIWIGTYYGGVSYCPPNFGQFNAWSMSSLAGSDEGYVVSCFCEDHRGDIWVGSDNGGLLAFNPQTGKVLHSFTPADGRTDISNLNIHSLCEWGDNIWAGTYTTGIVRISPERGIARRYDIGSAYAVYVDSSQTLWATSTDCLYRYEPSSDRFVPIMNMVETALDIQEAGQGILWLATGGKGLCRYDTSDGTFKIFRHSHPDKTTLTSDYVTSLWFDGKHTLWVSTNDGLCTIDTDDLTVKRNPDFEHSHLMFVTGDGTNIWLSAAIGLMRYSPEEGTIDHYNTGDGLAGDQFLENSGMVSSDGQIYVGSTAGFSSFQPQKIYFNKYIPPVTVTDFLVRRSAGKGEPSDGYEQVERLDDIILSSRENNVMVSYASLSYCSPGKNQYRCRLEGFDNSWRNVGNETTLTYTNLPAGHYTFRVKASNNDGLWNEQGAAISFTVKHHFLLSPVATIIYALIFLAAVYLVVKKLNRRSEDKYRQRYEALAHKREADDMAAKISFVTDIAHDVRTPLTLIVAPLEKILALREELPQNIVGGLDVIDRNCRRLLDLIDQLLDFSKVTASTVTRLAFEPCDIVDEVKSVIAQFQPSFEKHRIAFESSFAQETVPAVMDPEALRKIVSNLISNAIKYTTDKVSLTCRDNGDGSFSVTVNDNGQGIPASDRIKIFQPFYRANEAKRGTGIGLSIVKNLVEALDGTVKVDSVIGQGSSFTVTMPLEHEVTPKSSILDEELPEELATSKAPKPEMSSDGRPTILIVEDDEDMLTFLSNDFEQTYNVRKAGDGRQAWEILQTETVHLIISDWMMPVMTGDELCRRVRADERLCHIPFIILTAKSDSTSMLASLDFGADAHVKKPFSPEHLRALVQHLLDIRLMLARKYSSAGPLSDTESEQEETHTDFVENLFKVIDANISNAELSVEMLASEMCVSRSSLFSKVKAEIDDTPNHLILQARLKAAAKLLSERRYPVSEISFMVGFNSPSYFSKCFMRHYGMTPRQWSEKLQK